MPLLNEFKHKSLGDCDVLILRFFENGEQYYGFTLVRRVQDPLVVCICIIRVPNNTLFAR